MYSRCVKRSVIVGGSRTSISLEEPFWQRLKDIAARRRIPVSAVVREIDLERNDINLSSAIRTYILRDADQWLDYYRQQLATASDP